jgi:hypothetical protein
MKYFAVGLVVLLAYAAFYANKAFQPFKEIQTYRDETCTYLNTPEGQIEDITFTSDGVGIGSIDDKVTLFGKNSPNTPQGGFVAITLEPFAYQPIPVVGFPSEVNLHPHGVYLFQEKWLYAVNYGHARGGQRVEVFELIKTPTMSLQYHRSIQFGDEYMGALNDLVVLQDGEIYVSVWLPSPKDKETGFLGLKQFWFILQWTYLKATQLLRCDVKSANAVCSTELKGQQMNGVTTDGQYIYANDLFGRQIIRLRREDSGSLTEVERIEVSTPLDNIEYDKASKSIYGAGMSSLATFMKFDYGAPKCPGTAVEVKLVNGVWVSEEILTLDGMNTVSTAPRWKDYVVVGTWHDNRLGRCKLW